MKIRSKNRILYKMYRRQVKNSISRGHLPPEYTSVEFIKWANNLPIFHKLYFMWVKSGCSKDFIPSVDRLKNNIGYKFSNIEFVTWKVNRDRYYKDPNNLINNNSREVVSYDLFGNKIKDYKSLTEAKKETGATNIIAVCNGRRNKSGGLIWKYK